MIILLLLYYYYIIIVFNLTVIECKGDVKLHDKLVCNITEQKRYYDV